MFVTPRTMSPTNVSSAPVVLVHGAWIGPRCWDPVVASLGTHGVQPYVVTLKGAGSRRGENGPHISLDDHIHDVVTLIVEDDLNEVTLVGHSYGGRVITGVIATIPDRISRVVFVDAHAPVVDNSEPNEERRQQAKEHGGMLPFSGFDFDAELVGDADLYRSLVADIVDHPFETLTSPWQHQLPARIRRTYVRALGEDAAPFEKYACACRNDVSWSYIELDGSHMLQFSHPDDLATIIVGS